MELTISNGKPLALGCPTEISILNIRQYHVVNDMHKICFRSYISQGDPLIDNE